MENEDNLKTRIFSFIIQSQRNTAFIHTMLRADNTKVRILKMLLKKEKKKKNSKRWEPSFMTDTKRISLIPCKMNKTKKPRIISFML